MGGPLSRPPIHVPDGSGGSTWPVAIAPSMVATTRSHQGLARDRSHPAGTGLAVAGGLRVVFSNRVRSNDGPRPA